MLCLTTIGINNVQAQESFRDSLSIVDRTHVKQDAGVSQMLDTYIKSCKATENSGFPGYRVQIVSLTGTSARDNVLRARNRFASEYPEFTVYMDYKSPNFRLMVGDCRSKSDALLIKEKIKDRYPNAFVVYDKIQYPQLVTEDTQP